MFKRRIGPDPHVSADGDPQGSRGGLGCPDIWELESGDFAVIGIDQTSMLTAALPVSASCGPDERIVVLPRSVLTGAKSHIPQQ